MIATGGAPARADNAGLGEAIREIDAVVVRGPFDAPVASQVESLNPVG